MRFTHPISPSTPRRRSRPGIVIHAGVALAETSPVKQRNFTATSTPQHKDCETIHGYYATVQPTVYRFESRCQHDLRYPLPQNVSDTTSRDCLPQAADIYCGVGASLYVPVGCLARKLIRR
jgi:hypothetical protein